MAQVKTKVLYLAAQIQPVQHAQIQLLLKNQVQIALVSFEVSKLPSHPLLTQKLLSDGDVFSFVEKQDPDIVLCAGWMSRQYLKWCRKFKKQGAKTVCMMDNPWYGTLTQRIKALLGSWPIQSCFTHAWVPGKSQEKFARKLNFNSSNTLRYLYAVDTQKFASVTTDATRKRFLFYGRLIERKLKNFLTAYNSLSPMEKDGWELLIVGDGPMNKDPLLYQNDITLLPAQSTEALIPILQEGGVFVLIAQEEHWASSIQEAACAGMPLLISKQCGATENFIRNRWNGVVVDVEELDDIVNGINIFIHSHPNLRKNWSARSRTMGLAHGLDHWWKEWERLL